MNIEDALHEIQRCIDRVGFEGAFRTRWQACHDELHNAFVKTTSADNEAVDQMLEEMKSLIKK